jgi:hypothetical protein
VARTWFSLPPVTEVAHQHISPTRTGELNELRVSVVFRSQYETACRQWLMDISLRLGRVTFHSCFIFRRSLVEISTQRPALLTGFSRSTSVPPGNQSSSDMSAYGLDDRAIEVRSPAEAKDFFL